MVLLQKFSALEMNLDFLKLSVCLKRNKKFHKLEGGKLLNWEREAEPYKRICIFYGS